MSAFMNQFASKVQIFENLFICVCIKNVFLNLFNLCVDCLYIYRNYIYIKYLCVCL